MNLLAHPLAFMKLAVGAVVVALGFCGSVSAQGNDTPDPCSHLIRAWVDPVFGFDGMGLSGSGGGPIQTFAQVEDPTAPFKTLQHAIDAVTHHLVTAYNAGDTSVSAIVYAMPGVYGPASNGESFPILMRDRVSLQGLGARACILRGDGAPASPVVFFWPDLANPGRNSGEVLISFSASDQHSRNIGFFLPWDGTGESSEKLDGFTFQGGDVQVLFYKDFTAVALIIGAPQLRARITNCLFDMRHDWEVVTPEGPIVVQGPYFGIQMAKLYSPPGGYPRQDVLIANNTFLLGEFGLSQGGFDVVKASRIEAVAIIDVTDTGCPTLAVTTDLDLTLRGVGTPILANNMFRTTPVPPGSTPQPFAMLGIDSGDAAISAGGTATVQSNAFANSRVGSASSAAPFSNGKFVSKQVASLFVAYGTSPVSPLDDCRIPSPQCLAGGGAGCCNPATQPAPCPGLAPPTPVLEVFDGGTTGLDPLFVGEFLEPALTPSPTRYRDVRLLPGSPFINLGVKPLPPATSPQGPPTLGTEPPGWTFEEPPCEELRSFDWDHEGFGNPRISGATVDIGFDEFQMFIMAGSYGNDSNSHNVPGFLSPGAEPGRLKRTMIFAPPVGQATLVRVNGINLVVPVPPPSPTAWRVPPGTTRVLNPLLPAGFQTRWISFRNDPQTGTPTPWDSTGPGVNWNPAVSYSPAWTGQPPVQFAQLIVTADAEPSGPPSFPVAYFGTQAVFHAGYPDQHPYAWSNLQYEYR